MSISFVQEQNIKTLKKLEEIEITIGNEHMPPHLWVEEKYTNKYYQKYL